MFEFFKGNSKPQVRKLQIPVKEVSQKLKFPKKHILNLWILPLYFEMYMWMAVLININSLLYTLFILPLRFLKGCVKSIFRCGKDKRLRFEMHFF